MSQTAAEFLAEKFPALARYCPNLWTISRPQALFLLLDQREAFYGGAAGGGKSDALLMAALQYVDVSGYAALLLRRTYAELEKADGLIPRAEEWLAGTDARKREGGRLWVFPSGARLEFGHCENEADRHRFQSAAYQFIGFDELTSFPESVYTYIGFSRSRRRRTGRVAKVPIRVRSASNPGNVGHGWVQRRFVDPKMRKRGAVFVPAKVADNPGLDVREYRQTMAGLPEELQAQLLEGDWSVFEGMAFPDWDPRIHVVRSFPIPVEWERFESFDHGTTNPSCLLGFAVDYEGNIVCFDSHYAPGLPSFQAEAIRARRAEWYPEPRPDGQPWWYRCFADPEMWATKGETRWGSPASDITDYEELRVGGFTKAENDRSAGRTRIAELLKPQPDRYFPRWHHRHGEQGAPKFFVVGRNCPELVEQIAMAPLLPLDAMRKKAGEIVDPTWESRHGHAIAALRYGLMSRPSASERAEQVEWATPRDRMIHEFWENENVEQRRRGIDRSSYSI